MANNIQITLSPDKVALAPGDTAEFSVEVTNSSDVSDEYSVELEGIPPSWVRISAPNVSLMPKARDSVLVNVSPPVSATSETGSHNVSIKVVSKRDPAMATSASFVLELSTADHWEISLSPKQAESHKVPFHLVVTNNSRKTTIYRLAATDAEGVFDYRFSSESVEVGPGSTSMVTLGVNPKGRPPKDKTKRVTFTVSASPPHGEAKTVTGDIEYRATGSGCALGLLAALTALTR